MSGIFGLLNLDGRPIDRRDLDGMKASMAYWGPNGATIWRGDRVGLGHLMMYDTPESLCEILPLESKTDHLVVTADARLDNRDDLSDALEISARERLRIPDGALVLKAYRKWHSDCPKYLLGDWAFAIWDARQRQLFVARDHFGVSSLYYYRGQRFFAFASSIKGLLALPYVPRKLNRRVIARFAPEFNHDSETAYEGIRRVTPATAILVTGDKTEVRRYWEPAHVPELHFRSDADCLHAFLEVYTAAIQCRLRSHRSVGVALSGGLDSGSLAALASRALAQQGQRLRAVSWAPRHSVDSTTPIGRSGNETPQIVSICDSAPNIDLTTVTAENVGLLDSIDRTNQVMEQPECHPSSAYWVLAILGAAAKEGVGTLLSGWGGNFTVSWRGDRRRYLRSLLADQQLGKFLREAISWHTVNHASAWRTFRTQILTPLFPPDWLRRRHFYLSDLGSPLNRSRARALAAGHEMSARSPRSALDGLNAFFCHGRPGSSEHELGAAFGLDLRQPAMDKRVIEFCLGVPQDQYTRDGETRMLMRRGMVGLLPDSVLSNRRRGVQAAEIGHRARAESAELTSALERLNQSALSRELLDLPRMAAVLARATHRLDQTVTSEVGSILLRGLKIGRFLERFENLDGA